MSKMTGMTICSTCEEPLMIMDYGDWYENGTVCQECHEVYCDVCLKDDTICDKCKEKQECIQ
jgi:hypothetical protein